MSIVGYDHTYVSLPLKRRLAVHTSFYTSVQQKLAASSSVSKHTHTPLTPKLAARNMQRMLLSCCVTAWLTAFNVCRLLHHHAAQPLLNDGFCICNLVLCVFFFSNDGRTGKRLESSVRYKMTED
jgi:hypothetical protein